MKIYNNKILKFNYFIPIYNWYYPLTNFKAIDLEENPNNVFKQLETSIVKSRAFYFHIPFCKSICTFCPFVRTQPQNFQVIEKYTQALIHEIELKAGYDDVSCIPLGAIFFGGGSPSILDSDQIIRIGEAIKENYDLRKIKEYSFEMSIADITVEKLEALKEIGVTHARFGVQSFNDRYRKIFELKTSINDIFEIAKILPKYFPYVSFDMLYGMDGQTITNLRDDINKSLSLQLNNISFYPINNLVTQIRLHRKYKEYNFKPTSELTKFFMKIFLNDYMRIKGYLPHNGHEYVNVPKEELRKTKVVTNYYKFYYHKHIYGYRDHEVLGFGTNALSSMNKYVIKNTDSYDFYIKSLLNKENIPFEVHEHKPIADASKGLILHLPYYGYIEKAKIDWNSIYPETLEAFNQLLKEDLIYETKNKFRLTQEGWYWYVNLMYYLSPKSERKILDYFINQKCNEPERSLANLYIFN